MRRTDPGAMIGSGKSRNLTYHYFIKWLIVKVGVGSLVLAGVEPYLLWGAF